MVDSKDGRVSGDEDFVRRYDHAKDTLDGYAAVDADERKHIEAGDDFKACIASQQKTSIAIRLGGELAE